MARNHFILRNSREFLTSFYPNIIPRILENSQELGGGGGGGGGENKRGRIFHSENDSREFSRNPSIVLRQFELFAVQFGTSCFYERKVTNCKLCVHSLEVLRGCPRKNRYGKFRSITDCPDFFSGR